MVSVVNNYCTVADAHDDGAKLRKRKRWVPSRPGTEVIAAQILRYAEDGLWGGLSALGIII